MTRKQVINYLRSSGMSEEQINGVVEALTDKDCVSRAEAYKAIKALYPDMPIVDFNGSRRKWAEKYKPYKECADAIITLPSVIPARAKGKWEKAITPNYYRCSVCKGEHNDSEKGKWYEIFDTCAYNFCPNCGAKMEGVSE